MDIKAIIINYYNVAFKITETENLLLVKQAEIKQTVDDREKKKLPSVHFYHCWCSKVVFFFPWLKHNDCFVRAVAADNTG